MNKQVFTFFTEELAKVAGVELNLRGYSEDPTSYYKDPKTVDRDIEKYEALLDKSTPGTRPRKSALTNVSIPEELSVNLITSVVVILSPVTLNPIFNPYLKMMKILTFLQSHFYLLV